MISSLPSLAIDIEEIDAEVTGNSVLFTAKIVNFSETNNVTVQLHYLFEEDFSKEMGWNFTFMKYDHVSGLWKSEIPKKDDSGTIYYWVSALDSSQNSTIHYDAYGSEENPEKISYSPPIKQDYGPCLIGFFLGFVLFEIIMRYGPMKKVFGRKPKKDGAGDFGKTQESEDMDRV